MKTSLSTDATVDAQILDLLDGIYVRHDPRECTYPFGHLGPRS